MLTCKEKQLDFRMKSSEVCIKTESTQAWFPLKTQVSKQTTAKWAIPTQRMIQTPD